MRSETEISNEIVALKNALAKQTRWNDQARETIKQTIEVLQKRMSVEEIERTYYVDETMEDYEESDNDLYNALMLVGYWLRGDKDYKAPSKAL
jgi:hypothetical protein